jgi:hypothetical protein
MLALAKVVVPLHAGDKAQPVVSCGTSNRQHAMNRAATWSVLICVVLNGGCSGSSDPDTDPERVELLAPPAIYEYLKGKEILQAGSDVPPYPNGVSQNDACLSSVTLQFLAAAGQWSVVVRLGTVNSGVCNQNIVSQTLPPFADTFIIANVRGDATCFDIDIENANQSGRGSISADGTRISWEIYANALNPGGHRCANGDLGAAGVSLQGAPFSGNAIQVWRFQ